MSIAKVAVLAAGLVAAVLVATINPVPAQAFPRAASCAGCHASATGATTTVGATPSTATPAPGAPYTVAITLTANPNGGSTGFGIVAVAPTPAPSPGVFGGNTGSQLAFTANMVAPVAAGTYSYKVWTNQGIDDGTGQVGSKVYSITVAPAAVVPVSSFTSSVAGGVAPLTVAMTDTSTGTPTSWAWDFGNGTTSTLKSPSVTYAAAGTYTVTLTASNAGGAGNTATTVITVTAAPVAVTTTTTLAVTPASPVVAPASPTLTATVTGTGAAGTVEFFNGTTSLGTSPVAAGVATKALTGILAGSYSYHAVFTPTDAALFTPSTSTVVAFFVSATAQTLSGVVSANGVPVANAKVTAFTLAGVGVSSIPNASGTYSFALAPGSYKLYVTSPVAGYPSQWVGGGNFTTTAVTVFTTTATQNIALQGTALSGVVSASGVPVANAKVTAFTLAGLGLSTIPNASGTYALALAPGSYKLYVTSPLAGYPSQWVGGTSFATASVTVVTVAATQNIALHP